MPEELSLAARVYNQLKSDIVTCALAPGEALHEAQLAQRFGVSKTPVRAALNMLSRDGYVRVLSRLGYIVTPISLRDVHDVYQLRLLVEPAASALAAEHVDAECLRELQSLSQIRYTYGDRESYAGFLEANRRFHTLLATASGNARLAELVGRLLEQMERFFHFGLGVRDASGEIVHEHTDLVDALSAGDAERAEQLTREQITESRKRVVEALIREGNAAQLDVSPGP